MDDLTPEERRVVEWLRDEALNYTDPERDWGETALERAADAIERLEHRKAPQ